MKLRSIGVGVHGIWVRLTDKPNRPRGGGVLLISHLSGEHILMHGALLLVCLQGVLLLIRSPTHAHVGHGLVYKLMRAQVCTGLK